MKYPINIYDIDDNVSIPFNSMLTQLDNPPTEDVKKKKQQKSKAEENIIINDYNFVEDA